MVSVLKQNRLIKLLDKRSRYNIMDEDIEENVKSGKSWGRTGNKFFYSAFEENIDKLKPGIYKVDMNDSGMYFAEEIKLNSDALITFDNNLITSILEDINNFWSKSEGFKELNILQKRGIMLEGPPGTGKSSLITLICQDIINRGGVIFSVHGNIRIYIYFIKQMFRALQPDTPIIFLLEDLDKLSNEFHTDLLEFLDGKNSINHVLTLVTSNDTTDIPKAFLRPGRIDKQYVIPCLSDQDRRDYFKFKGIPDDKLDEWVSKTKDFTVSQCKELLISVFILENDLDTTIEYLTTEKDTKDYTSITRNILFE